MLGKLKLMSGTCTSLFDFNNKLQVQKTKKTKKKRKQKQKTKKQKQMLVIPTI
jgi:hypothetical protein